MLRTATRTQGFGPSAFSETTRLALEHGAVNLGQGFPDEPPPAFVLEAARRAAESGPQQYAPAPGLPALRQALSVWMAPQLGYAADPELEVTVASGATEAAYAAVLALVEPGDEVIVLEPSYDMYAPQIELAGGQVRYVPLEAQGGRWVLDIERLRAAVGPRTRGLVLNTPHNPTGKVFSPQELESIAAVVQDCDLWVLADEVYDRLTYAVPHRSIAALPGMRERTVTLGSAGKTFAVTGWRIGWAVAPHSVTTALRGVRQWTSFAAPSPLQAAVAECMTHPQASAFLEEQRRSYARRRDLLVAALRGAGLDPLMPEGGYFVMAAASKLGADDAEIAARLIRDPGVAAMHGSMFYAPDSRAGLKPTLRFAFCKRDETLEAAAQRLRQLG
ncbi:N-succinyldiaminopimelate aminotransferase [Deinobacterium chartae]|uniref:Aminotransferase n=1 Tax=Deinobacterium chartae TaxID=521158 RepID=A0A841I5V2_9DEIO|nr:aminotransferase class I/II-fold pyridoxal phosphate-dependent enzyme [Deinobacterium chartae]MBB6099302.1 N-succinyldiaminopimelate aminotransferase [Deinobacterium chartae]